jgi:hypothetical protein
VTRTSTLNHEEEKMETQDSTLYERFIVDSVQDDDKITFTFEERGFTRAVSQIVFTATGDNYTTTSASASDTCCTCTTL